MQLPCQAPGPAFARIWAGGSQPGTQCTNLAHQSRRPRTAAVQGVKTARGRAAGGRWTALRRHAYRAAMSLATVHSRALDGLAAAPVTVEVHLANGLPSFTVVGLADTEVKEARERVRAALQNSGLSFPANKRIKCSQAIF